MGIYFRLKANGNDFDKTEKFLKQALKFDIRDILDYYGLAGVQRLQEAVPKDTGKTADSFYYVVKHDRAKSQWRVEWRNSNVNDGVNIAVILQYGHGTRQGGYVEGMDYINPAMKPVFDKIAKEAYERMVSYYGSD